MQEKKKKSVLAENQLLRYITFEIRLPYPTPVCNHLDYYELGKVVKKRTGCTHCEMVKAMDCGIAVSAFVLQSRYYVHFRANTLEKGMNSIILLFMD